MLINKQTVENKKIFFNILPLLFAYPTDLQT